MNADGRGWGGMFFGLQSACICVNQRLIIVLVRGVGDPQMNANGRGWGVLNRGGTRSEGR